MTKNQVNNSNDDEASKKSLQDLIENKKLMIDELEKEAKNIEKLI